MTNRFEKFTRDITAASKCISKIKEHEMKRFGLHGGCLMCLFFIGRYPEGLTPSELCELCAEDKAGISRSLATLRNMEYIEILDEGRKYRAKYRITDKGKAIGLAIDAAVHRVVSDAGGEIDSEERDAFYRTFEIIVANLQALCAALDE